MIKIVPSIEPPSSTILRGDNPSHLESTVSLTKVTQQHNYRALIKELFMLSRGRVITQYTVSFDRLSNLFDRHSLRVSSSESLDFERSTAQLQPILDKLNMSEGSNYLPECNLVDGFPVWKIFPVEDIRASIDYKPCDDDIFLSSYPKCGGTWAAHTLSLILRYGENFGDDYNITQSGQPLSRAAIEAVKTLPRPFVWRTHLPFHLMPWSDKAKYICVARNPKDAAVSAYYHLKNMMGFTGTFGDYFEYFFTGHIGCGDFFGHLEGWYEQRNRPNVLFVTYEEMKENPEAAIFKIASFVDDAKFAEPLRQDPKKLENVLKYSSFKEMKVTINKIMDEMASKSSVDGGKAEIPEYLKNFFSKIGNKDAENDSEKPKSCDFVRKGIVGDWRNHFSEEQSRRLDEKFAERTRITEIAKAWKKYM